MILDGTKEGSQGITKPLDVETLCVSIVPSPSGSPRFGALIEAVVLRYGLKLKVARSELLDQLFLGAVKP